MRKQTVVVGARGAAAVAPLSTQPLIDSIVDSTGAGTETKSGFRRFISKVSNYRLQVTAPREMIDPQTGYRTSPEAIEAQFRNHALDCDIEKDQVKINALMKSKSRGLGRWFWTAEEQEQHLRARAVAATVNLVGKTDYSKLTSDQREQVRNELAGALKQLEGDSF